MDSSYKCFICGREKVKLWRPYMDTEPLICAKCAEERQSSREYQECIYEKSGDIYVGRYTGKWLALPKWTVDEKGKVPSYDGPGPEATLPQLTVQFIVNLNGVSESYSSGETVLIPAIPNEDGEFWGYTSVPEDDCKKWEDLPTK